MLEVFVFFLSGLAFQLSVFYSHPLVLGMGLLIFSVIMGMFLCYYGPIFSFCAFMVMVAGVLVVFSYTISLVPFKGFDYKSNKNFKSMNIFGSGVVLGGFFFVCFFSSMVVGVDSNNFFGMFLSYTEISYFTEDYSIFIVWMGLLLFLAMVFGASMCKSYEGALIQ
uniref:NADH dehydrogenase subunit 6 n=1 Tax=Meretrix lyrata TaxID=223151 RepID=V5JVC7_9BIVA|nr:NADH dehydrogenase subunit 6 [Meretrix lyrata]AGR50835.1 NADH dehydrogenase subunit 6 [Meretrix lyrata]